VTITQEPQQAAAAGPGSALVVEDRAARTFKVHRSAMTSEQIHAQELERVFAHSWLYVGHESEIPQPAAVPA
jgi:p-cumate 2,3-dioxygenase alpha subunit